MTSSTPRTVRRVLAALVVAVTGLVLVATPASAAPGDFTEYPGTGGFVTEGALGPDGNPWYASGASIATIDVLASGAVTTYAVPGAISISSLTAGSDGQLWMTDSNANRITSLNLTTLVFTNYATPSPNPQAIVTGPDGQLWIVGFGSGDLTSFNIGTSTFTSYPVGASSDAFNALTVGADGLIWISRYNIATLTSFDIGTSTATNYVIPGGSFAGATSLAATSDGLIWLNRVNLNSIVSFDPTTSTFAAYVTSGTPYTLTVGPDGNVWFSAYSADSIGTIDGVTVSQFALPAAGRWPTTIFAPQDNNIWFNNALSGTVGRYELAQAPVISTAVLANGMVGASYLATLAATGTTPITWSLSSGTLPAGLTLNGSTGAISGTPTAAGTSNFVIAANNAGGSDLQSLSLTIAAAGLAATGLDAWGTTSTALALLLLGGALMLMRRRRAGELPN